ncbi:MAG TPA: CdaR family protein [Kofleriaceae bacterium]|nr:CdaR family protein [Kofleriaceae bacterium]
MSEGAPRRPRTTRSPEAGPHARLPSFAAGEPGPEGERSFWRSVAHWVRGAFVDNAPLKFVALVLALTVFILVHSDERAVAGGTVKVNYLLPPDRVLVSEPVKEVSITVEGSRRRLKRFHEMKLDEIELDLRNMASGGEVFIESSMITGLPDGVDLISITPPSVKVELDQRQVKEVPVVVETVGTPGRGYAIKSVTTSPTRVKVAGGAGKLVALEAVTTSQVRLDGRSASFRTDARLVPPNGIEVVGGHTVQVEVVLGEEQGSRDIELPVSIKPGQGVAPEQVERFVAEPDRVHVVLRGSILAIDDVRPDQLSAYVTIYPDDVARGPTRKAEVHIPPLREVGTEITPAEITVKPKPP